MLDKLLINGFVDIIDSTPYNLIKKHLPNVSWNKSVNGSKDAVIDDQIFDILQQMQEYLGQTYVTQLFPSYEKGYVHFWNGLNVGDAKWHNDLVEGCNLFFLLYFNDAVAEDGGYIEFRNHNKELTGKVIPKKDRIIIGTHQESFQHKVSILSSKQDRICANFGFNIPILG